MARAGALWISVGARTAGFTKGLLGARRTLRRFSASVVRSNAALIGTAAAFVGIRAQIRLFRSVVTTFADFEFQMNRVAAITEATGVQFRALNDLAKTLGKTTVFTAVESAQAMTFLAQSGFKTKEILDALPGVLNLAAAGALDLGKAAEISADILRAMRLEVKELGRVNDVLVKTSISATTNVELLGEAMSKVGAIGEFTGNEIEDLAVILAGFAKASVKGSIAGIALRRGFLNLTSLAPNVTKALAKLNVEVSDISGNMRPMLDILFDIEKGLKRFSGSTERAAILTDIFGDRATVAFTSIIARGIGNLKDLRRELDNVGGTSQRVAERQMAGFVGALKRLTSAIGGVKIILGEALSPALIAIAKNMTAAFNDPDVLASVKTLGKLIERMVKSTATLNNNFDAISVGGNRFQGLFDSMFGLAILFERIKASALIFMGLLKTIASVGTIALNSLGGALATLLTPFAAIPLAIVKIVEFLIVDVLAGGLDILRKSFFDFLQSIVDAARKIPFAGVFSSQFDMVDESLKALEERGTGFKDQIKGDFEVVSSAVSAVFNSLATTASSAGAAIVKATDDIKDANKEMGQARLELSENLITIANEQDKLNAALSLETVKERAAANLVVMENNFSRFFDRMGEKANAFIGGLISSLEQFAAGGEEDDGGGELNIFGQLFNGLSEGFDTAMMKMENGLIRFKEVMEATKGSSKDWADFQVANVTSVGLAFAKNLGSGIEMLTKMALARKFDLKAILRWALGVIKSESIALAVTNARISAEAAIKAKFYKGEALAAFGRRDPIGVIGFGAAAASMSALSKTAGASAIGFGVLGLAAGIGEGLLGGDTASGGGGAAGGAGVSTPTNGTSEDSILEPLPASGGNITVIIKDSMVGSSSELAERIGDELVKLSRDGRFNLLELGLT